MRARAFDGPKLHGDTGGPEPGNHLIERSRSGEAEIAGTRGSLRRLRFEFVALLVQVDFLLTEAKRLVSVAEVSTSIPSVLQVARTSATVTTKWSMRSITVESPLPKQDESLYIAYPMQFCRVMGVGFWPFFRTETAASQEESVCSP